jgi:uncharacterized protein
MYLIDTNIWIELLLERSNSDDVILMLNNVTGYEMLISDFSFHSIGVIMTKLNKKEEFLNFITDIFNNSSINTISLLPSDMNRLISSMNKYKLDFDDAYQYICVKKYDLKLVTFDKDFNKTDLKIYKPLDII